jgi:hypothetical protein
MSILKTYYDCIRNFLITCFSLLLLMQLWSER